MRLYLWIKYHWVALAIGGLGIIIGFLTMDVLPFLIGLVVIVVTILNHFDDHFRTLQKEKEKEIYKQF